MRGSAIIEREFNVAEFVYIKFVSCKSWRKKTFSY